MFDLESEIKAWRAELERHKVGDGEILDELENHLRERFAKPRDNGMTEGQWFQLAVHEIGRTADIKREFAKLRYKHVASYGLKVFGIWFVLMGLRTLSLMPIFGVAGISENAGRAVVCLVLCAWQVLIGLGLLRQSNFWRWCALAWAALFLVFCLITLHPWQGSVADMASWGFQPGDDFTTRLNLLSHWRLTLLGTRLADFRHLIDFLSPAVMLATLYFLGRPGMKTPLRPLGPA